MERANLHIEAYEAELKEKLQKTIEELFREYEASSNSEEQEIIYATCAILLKVLAKQDPGNLLLPTDDEGKEFLEDFELQKGQRVLRLAKDGRMDVVEISDDVATFNPKQQAAWLLFTTDTEVAPVAGSEQILSGDLNFKHDPTSEGGEPQEAETQNAPLAEREAEARQRRQAEADEKMAKRGHVETKESYRDILRRMAPNAQAHAIRNREKAARSVGINNRIRRDR